MTWVRHRRRVPRVAEPLLLWLCNAWEATLPSTPMRDWTRWERWKGACWGVVLDAASKWPFQEHLAVPPGVDRRAPWRGF